MRGQRFAMVDFVELPWGLERKEIGLRHISNSVLGG